MAVETGQLKSKPNENSSQAVIAKWVRRVGRPLSILAWTAVVALILWAASHIIRSLLLLIIASLLAFALYPLAKRLQRYMPRFLAILIVYLLALGVLGFLLYLIINTAVIQGAELVRQVRQYIENNSQDPLSFVEQPLKNFGVTNEQIAGFRQQIVTSLSGLVGQAIPFLRSFLDFLLDIVIVAVISIYLLIDGERVTRWLRNNLPMSERQRTNFLLDSIQRIVGGYIRGQLLLATLIGVLVGGGMTLFHVPYAVLLGVLAFILEFIPVLGTLISGAVCVLIALSQGWLIAVGVLLYFVVVHVLEGDIIGPRIVGQAVGLHPVVSLVALVAGSELFGIWGALFASPLAGVLQALLVSFWEEWRDRHPEEFPGEKEVEEQLDKIVVDTPADAEQHLDKPVVNAPVDAEKP